MLAGAKAAGATFLQAQVTGLHLTGSPKIVETTRGAYTAGAVVLAMGAAPRKLALPEAERFLGRGLSYCATCDGMFFRNKDVAVLGGGNGAAASARSLARLCRQVHVIFRKEHMSAEAREQEALAAALNGFLEEDEASGGKREGGKSRRRLGGDKGRNARKAERELEADWEREKEKQQARHRSKARPKPAAAPEGKPPFLPDGEAPKEEDTRRRRGSRGRGRKPGVPRKDKPTEARAPNTPAEGKPSPAPEKGEKSGEGTNKPHRRWHHRGRRRPGGGANGGGSAPTPPAAN